MIDFRKIHKLIIDNRRIKKAWLNGTLVWDVARLNPVVRITVVGDGNNPVQVISSQSDMKDAYFEAFSAIYYIKNGEKSYLWKTGGSTYPRTITFNDNNEHTVYFVLQKFDFKTMTDNVIGTPVYGIPTWCFGYLNIEAVEWDNGLQVIGNSAFGHTTITKGLPQMPTGILYVGHDSLGITSNVKSANFVFPVKTFLGKYLVHDMGANTMPDYVKIDGNLLDTGVDSWFNYYSTFSGYDNKNIIFGEGVTKLRNYIFSWVKATLYFESAVPPTLPTNIGYNQVIKVYVPQGKLNEYVNAYGSVFNPSIIAEGKYQY